VEDAVRTITFGIFRPWEAGTAAIVTATLDNTVRDVKAAITSAATEWARTPSGAEATREHRAHGWDFNLGDLAEHLDDPDLLAALERHGVKRLEITTAEGYQGAWEFDDPVIAYHPEALP
jgi:hypothetical protein